MTTHEEAIQQEIDDHGVVVFCSGLTETELLREAAQARGHAYREVRMGMGDAAMRERFHTLQAMTGRETLPQVFVDGQFVGGMQDYLAQGAAAGMGAEAQTWVKRLGYAGLLPFAFGVLVLLFASAHSPTGQFFSLWTMAYGAVILSFLGATHWGVALARGQATGGAADYIASVVPALVGWLSLLLLPWAGMPLLLAGFLGWWGYERRVAARLQLPDWYQRLRFRLTGLVSLMLALAALLVWLG
ncbi:uncharacterized protein DUF3429 [Alkalispirillum mobile]|uniref:Uncharacterized protein DUF3429 n=1 Tax=Alkalispirillum mobile TaxID=85925 RepID=A0A498C4X7_9GAMM|nr:DUF3429 family protein [Alkalispirillum mobile]RLK51224.1 uncharacterized protein DUF3429 [Alkalispirillum mobile]